jgi:hypothetical protein
MRWAGVPTLRPMLCRRVGTPCPPVIHNANTGVASFRSAGLTGPLPFPYLKHPMKHLPLALAAFTLPRPSATAAAQAFDDKFRQLDELLPTPTATRTASGAPGHAYWQQRADYRMRVTLDEDKRAVSGAGTVTYHNNSPDTLSYLWVQLDQNMFRGDSDNRNIASSRRAKPGKRPAAGGARREVRRHALPFDSRRFDGGFRIASVTDGGGRPLPTSSTRP